MKTEVEVLEAKVRLLNQAIEILTDMKDDLERENKVLEDENEELKCDIEHLNDVNNNITHENKELKEHERTMEDSWQRLYGEKKQLEEWLEEETLKLQETEEYCQDLYVENKELKKDNERLTNVANNNYEFMMIYKNKYHELLENVNNLIKKYELEAKCHMGSAYGKVVTDMAYSKAGDYDDCK